MVTRRWSYFELRRYHCVFTLKRGFPPIAVLLIYLFGYLKQLQVLFITEDKKQFTIIFPILVSKVGGISKTSMLPFGFQFAMDCTVQVAVRLCFLLCVVCRPTYSFEQLLPKGKTSHVRTLFLVLSFVQCYVCSPPPTHVRAVFPFSPKLLLERKRKTNAGRELWTPDVCFQKKS